MAGKKDIVGQALRLAGKAVGAEGDDAARIALREAAGVPAHLQPGYKVPVAPGADDETRELVDYLNQRDPSLSFDPQSLQERREDLGMTVPGYHGSPRSIDRFSNQYSNPEGYWGGHHYFTSSPVDASENYAHPGGPDLSGRLAHEFDSILESLSPNRAMKWYEEHHGVPAPSVSDAVGEYGKYHARQNLGITNEGAVYPVNLRMKNPVRIDGPNQTFWGYDTKYDEAGDVVSEGGPAADLIQTTRDALADYGVHEKDVEKIVQKLYEQAADYGGIDAKSYRQTVNDNLYTAYDEEGNMVSPGHIMADVFQRMGHDSIDMATDVFAGGRDRFGANRIGMVGTGGDTRHYIIFDPKNIRSRFGAYDPFKAASGRISDAHGGAIDGDEDIDNALRIARATGGHVEARKGYAGGKRVVEDAVDLFWKELNRLKGSAPDDKTAVLRGNELIGKSRNFENGIPILGKYGARLGEMEARYDDINKLTDFRERRPHELVKEKAVIYPAVGDLSATGKTLTQVGDTPLVKPTNLEGGFEFSRDVFGMGSDPAGWASRPVPANLMAERLAERTLEGEQPYLTSVAMGTKASDSTHMAVNTLISMIPNSKIAAADIAKFDDEMSKKFKGWPGIMNTEKALEFMDARKRPGTHLSAFTKALDKQEYRKAGFPDPAQMRFAVSEPRLLGLPPGSSGFTLMKVTPSGQTVSEGFQHGTYSNKIPSPEGYSGGFKNVTPSRIMFPEWYDKQLPMTKADPTLLQQSLMTQFPKQKATNEWADNLEKYWEENPMPWGYAYGGEVDDDDIDNALRIARATGGRAGYAEAGSVPVFMEDAKGRQYDAQGNVIPQSNTGDAGTDIYKTYDALSAANPPLSALPSRPTYSDIPSQLAKGADRANSPVAKTREPTNLEYWRMMPPEKRAELIAEYPELEAEMDLAGRVSDYENLKKAKSSQPYYTQSMTHDPYIPRTEMKIDMPLFGGEHSLGQAPYNVSDALAGMAQTAYDWKTTPFYYTPLAPLASGVDLAEGFATTDPLQMSMAALGVPNKYAKAAIIGGANYLMDPANAEAGPERWFSKLFRAAEALPMEKMTGQQALAMLRKTAPQEEIKWTGLEGFATDNPVTTKKALLDYLKQNQVQTQDVVLGGNKPARRDAVVPSETAIAPYKERWDELVAQNRAINEVMLLPPSQRDADIDDLLAQRNDIQYEMDQIHDKAVDATIKEMGGLGKPTRYGPGSSYGDQFTTPGGENYTETLVRLNGDDLGYQSGHWEGFQNVIGHIRTQTLYANPPGANRPLKLFNVDEAQSDMAQAGRDRGFKNPEIEQKRKDLRAQSVAVQQQTEKFMNDLNGRRDVALKPFRDIREATVKEAMDAVRAGRMTMSEFNKIERAADDKYFSDADNLIRQFSGESRTARDAMNAKVDEIENEMRGLPAAGSIDPAPYVAASQGWTDLSIKKALDQAIDSGADYFTFTPGELQAERYNLSNHIGKVQYNPDDGSLLAYNPKGKMVINESVSDPSDLEEYLGKELAQKMRLEAESRRSAIDEYEIGKDEETGEWTAYLYGEPIGETFPSKGHVKDYLNEMMANEFANSPVELSGLDLKVGGEGMIDAYNNIYKKRVEKVVKDLTGKKVQWEVLPAETSKGVSPRLGFRIDDDLREAKFPTFASGGKVGYDAPHVNKALALTRDY